MSDQQLLIVCMGVSGSGKTTLAQTLAAQRDFLMLDADDYHSEENKALMRRGIALTNEQRSPWMKTVCAALLDAKASGRHCVIAHSGLQAQHRQQLRALGFRTIFAFLDGDRVTLSQRISQRSDHFMPAELLETQYAVLQNPCTEDDVVILDINLAPEALASHLLAHLDAACEIDRACP